jgi:hypothetical protein
MLLHLWGHCEAKTGSALRNLDDTVAVWWCNSLRHSSCMRIRSREHKVGERAHIKSLHTFVLSLYMVWECQWATNQPNTLKAWSSFSRSSIPLGCKSRTSWSATKLVYTIFRCMLRSKCGYLVTKQTSLKLFLGVKEGKERDWRTQTEPLTLLFPWQLEVGWQKAGFLERKPRVSHAMAL